MVSPARFNTCLICRARSSLPQPALAKGVQVSAGNAWLPRGVPTPPIAAVQALIHQHGPAAAELVEEKKARIDS